VTNGDVSAAETVDILHDLDPLSRWVPVVGTETLDLLDNLGLRGGEQVSRRLLGEAASTLARCHPPTDPNGRETGLVIGYVQSGKTTNFTAVTALARDNGYRMVIVCTGVTVNLFGQSRDRLRRDLRIDARTDRQWLFLDNPNGPAAEQMVQAALDSGRMVLITVMKNGRHLDNLSHLLANINLSASPALLIDDEADQASLNSAVRQGNQTATYRRILALRDLLPHHTFLQYTATPQALLLINLIDVLSPSFADVLTPGPLYTGGRVFLERDMDLIREIPAQDTPSQSNPLTGAPPSLLDALRSYWLGVAAGLIMDAGSGNRSMMVHPSQHTAQHADYNQWVRQVQHLWTDVLAAGPGDPDREELVADFRSAYADLDRTADNLPSFDQIIGRISEAISQTIVTEVNAARGRTPQPDYRQFYAHILVGGEVLNRGVTVEGLTVTYMPRGRGTGQADTIQQRARWFGYKADYLGYCRVYLSSVMRQAYQAYVDHEEALRGQLREHRSSGNDLRDWRRAFFLDPTLRPTRKTVIDLEPLRGNFTDEWFIPKAPQDPVDELADNVSVVAAFVDTLDGQWIPDEGHARRTDMQIHDVARPVPLASAFENLLTKLHWSRPVDSALLAGLLLQVGRFLDLNPDAACTVYRMSQGRVRMRSLDIDDAVPTLFQGANYDRTNARTITLYPGDNEIHDPGQLSIQIHTLELHKNGDVVAANVPAVAVWVPRSMGRAWISQHQN